MNEKIDRPADDQTRRVSGQEAGTLPTSILESQKIDGWPIYQTMLKQGLLRTETPWLLRAVKDPQGLNPGTPLLEER